MSGPCLGNPCLEFFALFSAAVGRRPYLHGETEGAVIVSTDASLKGASLTVSAALESPAIVVLFSRASLRGGTKAKMPFTLDSLPATVNGTLLITLHLPTGQEIVAVGETVILLHPPLSVVGVSIAMERDRQQNDSLANG